MKRSNVIWTAVFAAFMGALLMLGGLIWLRPKGFIEDRKDAATKLTPIDCQVVAVLDILKHPRKWVQSDETRKALELLPDGTQLFLCGAYDQPAQ